MTIIKRIAVIVLVLLPAWAPADDVSPLTVAQRAPRLVLPDLHGQYHDLAAWRGRVVVVNFWASWCPPCRAELPSLWRMQHALNSRALVVASVNVGERAEVVRAILPADMQRDFVVLMDPSSNAFRRWRNSVLPATYVIGAHGRIRYLRLGGKKWDDRKTLAMLRRLLQQAG